MSISLLEIRVYDRRLGERLGGELENGGLVKGAGRDSPWQGGHGHVRVPPGSAVERGYGSSSDFMLFVREA